MRDRATKARAYVTLDELVALKHRAKGFSFLPRQPVHSLLNGRHASRLRGRGLEFEELRHYVEGDDTRTIDWPATARLGDAYVRVFTEERDRPVLLLVDQRLSMFFGSRSMTKSVAGAEAAALAAWRVTSLGDRIGAIVFSENGVDDIGPRARDHGATRVLAAIQRHNGKLTANDSRAADPQLLNAALRRAVKLASHDWLVCLVTDAMGADAETVKLVTQLTAHNDVLTILVQDPLERELPDIGTVHLAEGDGRIDANLSASSLRAAFAAASATGRESVERFSRRRAIPVLPISTARPVSDQLRELLGQRLASQRFAAVRPAGRVA